MSVVPVMFIWGTVNPVGESNNYKGFYYTEKELQSCLDTREMIGKPVKVEHKGVSVGQVVSAWKNSSGQVDCMLEVDEDRFEGAVVSKFVDQKVCKELSLGYVVDIQNTGSGSFNAVNKKIVEVSIVKKGARDKCFIHGYGAARK